MCYFQLLFALFSFSLVLSVTNASEICNQQSALLTQMVLFFGGESDGSDGCELGFCCCRSFPFMQLIKFIVQ